MVKMMVDVIFKVLMMVPNQKELSSSLGPAEWQFITVFAKDNFCSIHFNSLNPCLDNFERCQGNYTGTEPVNRKDKDDHISFLIETVSSQSTQKQATFLSGLKL